MKDNNSIDAAGFFLSQADIDKINSNNDEIGNPDWFTGVTEGESDKEGYDEYKEEIEPVVNEAADPEMARELEQAIKMAAYNATMPLENNESEEDIEPEAVKSEPATVESELAAVKSEPAAAASRAIIRIGEKLGDLQDAEDEKGISEIEIPEQSENAVADNAVADNESAGSEDAITDTDPGYKTAESDEAVRTTAIEEVQDEVTGPEPGQEPEPEPEPGEELKPIPEPEPEPKPEPVPVPAKTIVYERAQIEAAVAAHESLPSESSDQQKAAIKADRRAEETAIKEERRVEEAAIKAERRAEEAAIKAERRAEAAAIKEERKKLKKAYRGEGPARRIFAIVIGVLLIASAAAALIYLIGSGRYSTEYVAGSSNVVKVYAELEEGQDVQSSSDESGGSASSEGKKKSSAETASDPEKAVTDGGLELMDAGALVRGTEVRRYNNTETLDDIKLCRISVSDTESGEETEYYIDESNLAKDKEHVVQETDVWVRTPATIYEREYSPAIASFAPKGTHLKVIGYDKLLDNGYINKYKVEYDPVDTKKEDKAEGFVYGKYMAATQEEAKAPYNEHGETDNARKEKFGFELYGGKGENLDWYPYEKTKIEGNKFCKNARAMYLNSYAAVHPDAWLKIIKSTDCNAVVLDIKDGPLTFKAETAKELSPTSYKNAYVSEEKLKKGIDKYRDAGVYLIGRIVVFNDQYYAKDHPENCIKYGSDRSWPSAFSRDVWEYNVRLAQEAVEKFGFNEIQFDYVRFPEASYEMSKSGKADFRNKYGEEKAQAVQNFCFYACDQLREAGVYTSVDVFGESAYSYVTAYGQYWASISNIVDAISAMPYTDHFSGEAPWEHPYASVLRWAKRAAKRQKRIQHPAAARTWITGYNTPYWDPTVNYNTKRMKDQIRALKKAGLKGGFIPWNALSDLDKYNQYKDIWNK